MNYKTWNRVIRITIYYFNKLEFGMFTKNYINIFYILIIYEEYVFYFITFS